MNTRYPAVKKWLSFPRPIRPLFLQNMGWRKRNAASDVVPAFCAPRMNTVGLCGHARACERACVPYSVSASVLRQRMEVARHWPARWHARWRGDTATLPRPAARGPHQIFARYAASVEALSKAYSPATVAPIFAGRCRSPASFPPAARLTPRLRTRGPSRRPTLPSLRAKRPGSEQ